LGQKFGDGILKSKEGLDMRDVVLYTKDKRDRNRLFNRQKEGKFRKLGDSTVKL